MEEYIFRTFWSNIDQTDDPTFFVRWLEVFRPNNPDDPETYRDIFQLLQVQEGQYILDIGCGLGSVARALAQSTGASGLAIGVDNSKTMIRQCHQLSKDSCLSVKFYVANAHYLPFDDGIFDGCCSIGLLEIVDNPYQVLAEMVRVAKRGAHIVVRAPDFGTVALDATDREVTRKFYEFLCDAEMNGWIGRQLLGLYKEFNLTDIIIVPQTWIERDYKLLHYIWSSTGWIERAQASGVVSAAEVDRWLAQLEEAGQADKFFHAMTWFLVGGRKP